MVLRLRDGEDLDWTTIAAAMPGRTASACEQRYYGKLKGARDRAPRRTGPAPKPGAPGLWRRPVVVNVPLAEKPVAPLAPVVEIRRMPSLDHLRERAELQLRIDRQGLTAGFFGDPPPGRSALDERIRAAAAARDLPYKRGGLDGY